MRENIAIKPEVCEDGWYCYCSVCGHYDLIPIQHGRCPKCGQHLDWNWYKQMKITKQK